MTLQWAVRFPSASEDFAFMFIRDTDLSFLCVSLLGFGLSVMVPSRHQFGSVVPPLVHEGGTQKL